MMSRRSLLFVLLLTLGVAACERQEPRKVPPAAPTDEPTAIDPAMRQTSECIHRDEGFAIAIQIGFEPVPFATLNGEVLGRRDLTRERTTVDGREALCIKSETTGEGLHDRGIRMYQYFVDLGDTTMVAATHDVGVLPFERKRRILDAMMATVDFREPERGG